MAKLLDVENLGELLNLPAQLSLMGKRLQTSGVNTLHSAVQAQIDQKGISASGRFQESIEENLFQSVDDYYASVGSSLDYALTLEEGRGANKARPPVSSILQWMVYRNKEATLYGAIFLSRWIAEHGSTGKFIFRDAALQAFSEIQIDFNRELDLVLGRD